MQINQVKKSNEQLSTYLMVNEDHKFNNLSEQNISGAKESSNIFSNMCKWWQ